MVPGTNSLLCLKFPTFQDATLTILLWTIQFNVRATGLEFEYKYINIFWFNIQNHERQNKEKKKVISLTSSLHVIVI